MPIKLTSLRYAEERFARAANTLGSAKRGVEVSHNGGTRSPSSKAESSAGKATVWAEKNSGRAG
jgi:hypothetical protein